MGPKLEDFKVIDIIGRGSHGVIKRVKRKSDGQILVWKELHYVSMNEVEKQGLVLEVNLLRELHHPHIVRFFNHIVDRRTGTLFIFMEYCSGGDLRHLISRCRKTGSFLEEGFVWKVLKQMCEALKACHESQFEGSRIILHRDIKPANVFLDKDGNIKLGDFGLARTLNSNASFAKTFVGTPYYMSPEVIDGREYNERSDIWSLGCLMYELCSLEPPFKASNESELKSKIKAGKFRRIPVHYSSGLWEVIQEMLRQNEFLRPSAFMLLHHSALEANTSPKEERVDDDLSESIALLLEENKRKNIENQSCNDSKTSSQPRSVTDVTDEEGSSCANSFETTVKENILPDELKRMEESLMREVELLLRESQIRKEKERQERLQGNPLNLSLLESPTEQDKASARDKDARMETFGSEDYPGVISLRQKIPSPPKCVCGGTSLEDWKERVSSVRAAEESVRQREMAVEERERELAKRERRLHSIEQEAKQHLVRAQIYLKQTKSKGQNVPSAPKLGRGQEASDFDATTVSADLGYDETPTVAFLDTQPQNNPFLRMRENLNKNSQLVNTNTNLSRSNTLDNPKSRRKHGIYYYLEKSGDKLQETNRVKRRSQIDHQTSEKDLIEGNYIENDVAKAQVKPINQCPQQPVDRATLKSTLKGNLLKVDQKTGGKETTSILKCKNTSKCKTNLKENTGNILETLRQNFMRNNGTRKSTKNVQVDKENEVGVNQKHLSVDVDAERKPLRAMNVKRCQSRGVCAVPGKNVPRGNAKQSSLLYFDPNRQNVNSRDHVFRFYNAV